MICIECGTEFVGEKRCPRCGYPVGGYGSVNNQLSNELSNAWNSTITVLENCIKLEHKGASAIMMGLPRGEKTIGYDDFTSVEFKPSQFMSYGYIQFNVPGHTRRHNTDPLRDEYTFGVQKSIEDSAKRIYDLILENKKKFKAANNGVTVVQQVSAADEILKLKQLVDAGILTAEEFEAKKKQLLGL